ncbi:MAG: slipin family protein [Chloroflexi bacterium]|nr:slipin family protein [Chloroflexota bacterium]
MPLIIALVVILVLLVIIVPASVRIVQEYERGVIFRLGRLVGARGPGLFFLIPYVERMIKVDQRIVTMDVPSQECITLDNVTVKVDAVVYFRVVDPQMAVVRAVDFIRATSLIAQTTLRSTVGEAEMDSLLSRREQMNQALQRVIDEQTEPWGVKVSVVEIRDVEMASEMRRAMARQAEAERERRAKIIHAEGEFSAAQRLVDAANIIASQPAALQLRYLQTLADVATERTSLLVFPLPIDLITAFMQRFGAAPAPSPAASSPPVSGSPSA